MDITLLHNVCKDTTKDAYSDYKHYITNSLFEVNNNLIDLELSRMTTAIGQKINKKYFVDLKYPEQYKLKEKIVNDYKSTAVKYGKRFAKKFKTV